MKHLICAVCGDRIGVYEPFLRAQPDGSLISSSFRAIQDGHHRLHAGMLLLHEACGAEAKAAGAGPIRDHHPGSGA